MKRFICLMLTLIMLVSLVPMAALPASAATFATSEAAITVIKNALTFRGTCYQVDGTDECRIGYGSVCKGKHEYRNGELGKLDPQADHKMNQAKADNALREELKKMDKKVNSFATSNGLSLNQNKFDALSVLSYLYGTAWMNGNGTIKTALKNNASSTELLNAVNDVTGSTSRSKIIVNMYKNNVYSNDLPSNYSSVIYNANGGKISKGDGNEYTMQFDASAKASHNLVPTRNGYKFMGWYFSENGGKTFTERSTRLNSDCAGETLYALWQKNGVASETVGSEKDHPTVYFKVYENDLASDTIYNRPSPDGKEIGDADDEYIDREYIRYDGSRWGRIKGTDGWICISGGSSSSSSDSDAIGVTVTNAYVNYREKPSVFGKKLGKFNQGKKLYVEATSNADGYLWGEVAETKGGETVGWVALMYTNWNSVKDGPSKPDDSESSGSKYVAQATITYNGYVNLRNGAGTDHRIIGSLAKNETVNITEIKTVNGHQWGNIGNGWFCMTYANVTMLSGNSDISNEGSKAYTFSGIVNSSDIVTYVDTTTNSNKTEYQPKLGKPVSIVTLKFVDGQTWAKIGWKTTVDKKTVDKYGWVQIQDKDRSAETTTLSSTSTPVKLNALDFQVVADSVAVREEAGSDADSLTTLNKGYQFEVEAIKLVNEQIWGQVQNDKLMGGASGSWNGWINLASKYVKRTDMIEEEKEEQEENASKQVATVINVDKVNVRSGSAVTHTKVGELKRGAVANVLDEDNGWYLLDVDVDNDPDTESWVSGDYLDVRSGSSSNGNINAPSSTGIGVVANTYAGVNVRSGAGTSFASVGKLLPGTRVDIIETKFVGSTKWGKVEQGWVCMDYITMITEAPTEPETPDLPNGGTSVGDYDDVEKTTTTAVYTGTAYIDSDEGNTVKVWATTRHHDEREDGGDVNYVVRELSNGDPVTIYELLKVTERVESGTAEDGNTTETVVTSYWARVNDGYIRNPGEHINLDALDEQTHTLVGSDTLRVRDAAAGTEIGKIEKGDKVTVTSLKIVDDKVWGKIEYADSDTGTGWIRLDYMAEGAFYEQPKVETPPAPPVQPPIGDTGSTGNGGFVGNSGGYKYTGKIIRSDGVKIRNSPSTTAKVNTTKDKGDSIVIYETTIADNRAWGRCDAGWVYLYYVDMDAAGLMDVRVVYTDNTLIYSDMNMSETVGTYAKMSVIEITEIVGKMAHTDLGWVSTDDLL